MAGSLHENITESDIAFVISPAGSTINSGADSTVNIIKTKIINKLCFYSTRKII